MKVEHKSLSEITPYIANAKKHDKKQIKNVAESIKQYGFVQPIVIDRDGVIVIGHCRALAAQKLGMEKVPCVCVDDLTPEQVAALRLVDNKSNESDWDMDLLGEELGWLDMSGFDFDWGLKEEADKYVDAVPGKLREMFVQPPFSVLDARRGDWQKRKKVWGELINSGNGRGGELLGQGMNSLAKAIGSNLSGTSIFDPCLCETLLFWFTPRGGKIIDPFAGGSVRGLVSSYMEREYHGCDLSRSQIDANEENYSRIQKSENLFGGKLEKPHWYCGDSSHIDEIIPGEDFDGLLTCPPYADLEIYSSDPADISNMPYDRFLEVYTEILRKAIGKLKENTFACVIVGEVRDKNGHYRNFIGDTITACEKAGAKYYNEIILVTMTGTGALRAKRPFESSRKVMNTHQKALVFLKSGGNETALDNWLDCFDRERILQPMKESVLVFLKGQSKLAIHDLESYEFPEF